MGFILKTDILRRDIRPGLWKVSSCVASRLEGKHSGVRKTSLFYQFRSEMRAYTPRNAVTKAREMSTDIRVFRRVNRLVIRWILYH